MIKNESDRKKSIGISASANDRKLIEKAAKKMGRSKSSAIMVLVKLFLSTPVTVNLTKAQWEILKRACKLAGLYQDEFVAKAAQEFITLHELRGTEKNFKNNPKSA